MWDDQFELLAEHYHVLRYDLRGFGRSASACADPYAPIRDLEVLLELLQIESTTVVGLSFGGPIAVDLAVALPSMTNRLSMDHVTVLGENLATLRVACGHTHSLPIRSLVPEPGLRLPTILYLGPLKSTHHKKHALTSLDFQKAPRQRI